IRSANPRGGDWAAATSLIPPFLGSQIVNLLPSKLRATQACEVAGAAGWFARQALSTNNRKTPRIAQG
ncbi:MAG TPA: hypothetical protein VM760_07360, partial [Sphingomicrobium sp.]|nr:hypothetical protein [Sphingomicrobium sp.]